MIEVQERSAAPPERVWELLADAASWSTWTRMSDTSLEREGEPNPDGVGAIRRFRTGPLTSREEVVTFEPSHLLVYRLLSGLPLDDYEARVELSADGEGTRITWSSRSQARYPGTAAALRLLLSSVIRDIATRLARAAER